MDAVEVVNSLPAERLGADLLACCAAPAWGATIAAHRPYRDRAELIAVADAAARGLSWDEVRVGLSAHSRIGEPPAGGSREAAWSRQEQAAVAADDEVGEVNRAYHQRFGYAFLICATGRTRAEIVAAARERLNHDEATERAVVAEELRKIALLRLERVLDALR